MKKLIPIVILLAIIAYGLYDTLAKDKSKEQPAQVTEGEVGLEKGNFAPDFELKTLDGKTMKLSELRGKKVIINFWATWCPPCRAEMPEMQKFHEEYGDEVVIAAVNATTSEKNIENVHAFVKDFGLTFPILLDDTNEVNMTYSIVSIPTSFFVDTSGMIQQKFIGAMSYDQMKEWVDDMK